MDNKIGLDKQCYRCQTKHSCHQVKHSFKQPTKYVHISIILIEHVKNISSPVKSVFLVHDDKSNVQTSITDYQQDAELKTVIARMFPCKSEVEKIEEGMS